MKLKHLLFCILTLSSIESKAQDPIFTQFFLMPETINPAFTGIGYGLNTGILHRRQWPNENKRIDTQYAYINDVPTNNDFIGLGITVLNHHEVFTNYNYFQFNGVFSYSIPLDNIYKWSLRFGLEAGYGRKDYNFSNLLLEDQISITDGSINPISNDPFGLNADKINFFDLSTGLALVQEDAWFGVTLKHLTRPNISFDKNGNTPLDIFLSAHGGYYFKLPKSEYFVLITANYMRQGQNNRLDFGGNVDLKSFSIGILAATNPDGKSENSHFLTSINPIVTIKWKQFIFGYSYDINTSKIGKTQGVHELTISWLSEHSCGPTCDNYKVKLKRNGIGGLTK